MITVGTNSYLTVAEFKANCDLFGYDYSAKTDPEIEQALTSSALLYIDPTFTFKGEKLDENQAMDLPTDEVAIADIAKGATQAAWQQLTGYLFVDPTLQSVNGKVTSESKSVGSLSKSVDYEEGTALTNTYSTVLIRNLLRPYLAYGSGGLPNMRVL